MKQNHKKTQPNYLPNILTYIALVLVVTCSQEGWDSWDFLVGLLGVIAFMTTARIITNEDKIEALCNSLLFGISIYILICATSVIFGFFAEPIPIKPTLGDTPITGEQLDKLLCYHLFLPGSKIEKMWYVITFVFAFIAFIITGRVPKDGLSQPERKWENGGQVNKENGGQVNNA